MKNKKIKNFVIIFLLCFTNYISCNNHKEKINQIQSHQLLNCSQELDFEKKLSLSKLVIIPIIAGFFIGFNKNNIIKNVKEYPLFTLIISSILCSFFIDTAIKYKQINNTICLFELSKDLSRYILFTIAIKNTMIKISQNDKNCDFCEESFTKIITNQIPLSFNELEQFTSELLHNCIKTIHSMNIKIHTDLEEQIYLLCKEHVKIEDILTIYKNDSECYQLLKTFIENPNNSYKDTALKLNNLIKNKFIYMINNNQYKKY